MKLIINFVAFQLGWFATVLSAAKGIYWFGPLVVLAVVALHLLQASRPVMEARLLLFALVLGLGVDSLVLAGGWIHYPGGTLLSGLAPYWIITMWALFATTLNVSMRWMHRHYVVAALFGGVGGPISYLAGAKLGAMSFVAMSPAIVALAIAWSVAMPLLVFVAAHFDGFSNKTRLPYIYKQWSLDSHV